MKKVISIAMVMMLAVATLFAGGTGEATAANSGKNLLVSVWAGPHADLQKQVVADYPDANVTIDDVDYGNLKAKQLTSFQAAPGSGNYDVVWVNSLWMKEYTDAGYILPLNDYIEASGLDTSMYSKGLLDGCTFDGQIYGFPTYAQTMILVYDKAAFEEEGLEVPTTADELIAVAKHFKEKGTGIAFPEKQGSGDTLFSQLLFSEGGSYFDENGRPAMDSPEAIRAATIIDELGNYAIDGCLAWHHDECAEAVRMKDAPIAIVMSALCNQNHDPEKSLIVDTVGYAPMPGTTGLAAATNTFWVWALASNATDPQAAYDLCEWLASPEVEKRQTIADQQISAIETISSDSEVLEKAPFIPVVMEQLANGKTEPSLVSFAAYKTELQTALSEIATTDEDPAVIMQNLQAKLETMDFSY